MSASSSVLDTCERLLLITQAQTAALLADDFACFGQLFDQRTQLAQLIDQQVTPSLRQQVRQRLLAIAALDQENIFLARRLLEETARALKQVQHGQTAMRGYGRPGANLSRPDSLIDRAS
jgi:FAD synthase